MCPRMPARNKVRISIPVIFSLRITYIYIFVICIRLADIATTVTCHK